MSKHVDDLIQKSIDIPREKFIVEYVHENNKLKEKITELEKENAILKKALNLYVNWADECGVAWDNFPDMTEKWYKVVEEKGEEIYKDLYERRMYVHRHGECLTIEEDDSEYSVFSGSQEECEDYIENM